MRQIYMQEIPQNLGYHGNIFPLEKTSEQFRLLRALKDLRFEKSGKPLSLRTLEHNLCSIRPYRHTIGDSSLSDSSR